MKINDFLDYVKNYDNDSIECTKHTFFRFSDKQINDWMNCEKVKTYIKGNIPLFIGEQNNGCYAVFYQFEQKKAIKIIVDVKPEKIKIVTLYVVDKKSIPKKIK